MPKGKPNDGKTQLQLEMSLLKRALGIFERAVDGGIDEAGVVSVINYLNQRYLPAATEE